MSTIFECFKAIKIVDRLSLEENCDNSTIDYSKFDYLDLSPFTGSEFTKAANEQELKQAFLDLNINIEIQGCEIILLTNDYNETEILSHKNVFINFIKDGLAINPLDFTLYNRLDLLPYDVTPRYLFVYSEYQLLNKLTFALKIKILIDGDKVILDKYYGEYQDIEVGSNPSINLVESDGSPVDCDFNKIQSINLGFYGGNVQTIVNSENSVKQAFSALGINVKMVNCSLELVEYTGALQDVPVCYYPLITFLPESSCVNNSIDYSIVDYVDFTPIGGTEVAVSNNNDIKTQLQLINYNGDFDGCKFKITNKVCESDFTLNTRTVGGLIAVNDLIPCIVVGNTFTINPTLNDINTQNQSLIITHINGTSITIGGTVSLATGVLVRLIDFVTIKVETTPLAANTPNAIFTYTVMNTDNVSSTANINYCITNVIVPGLDTFNFECNSSAALDLSLNDQGIGPFTITHINNLPIVLNTPLELITGKLVVELINSTTIKLTSVNMFHGMGSITYTITNGGTSNTGTITYNISNACDDCLFFDIDFTSDSCGTTCWTDLTYNGLPIDNYKLKLKLPNGNFYILPNNEVFTIGKGIYATGALPPNHCIPMEANTYSLFIEFSDIDNNLDCPNNTVLVTAMPCNTTCDFEYSGDGGVAAQLSFNVEVSASSLLRIISFTTFSVPDGLVIYYNGIPIYHTGASVQCPYISTSGSTSGSFAACIGCVQATGAVQNIDVPIPYVSGVDTARVVILGYPCNTSNTLWRLTLQSICN